MTEPARRSGRIREWASFAVLLVLVLPCASLIPSMRWNLHVLGRLRAVERAAPDSDTDRIYRSLIPHLPETGPIAFDAPKSMSATDASRTLYFLQYSLAPRMVLPFSDSPWVIAVGAPDAALRDDRRYALVADTGTDVRLFHRIAP